MGKTSQRWNLMRQ